MRSKRWPGLMTIAWVIVFALYASWHQIDWSLAFVVFAIAFNFNLWLNHGNASVDR